MHEDTSHQGEPHAPSEERLTERTPEALIAARTFPAAPAESAGARRQRGLGQRVVLPVAIFLGFIAALAWVSQYLPSWHGTNAPLPRKLDKEVIVFYQPWPVKDAKEIPPPLDFQRPERLQGVIALWNAYYPPYRLEFEKTDNGFYDYLFMNESNEPAEVGLAYKSCTCSQVRICVLPSDNAKDHIRKVHQQATWSRLPPAAAEPECDWKDVIVGDTANLLVPPGHGGLVRLVWKGERASSDLSLKVWAQPKDKKQERQEYIVRAYMALSEPLHFLPDLLDFGELPENGSAVRDFLCWSGTRDHIEIDFPENKDHPCIQCSPVPLTPAECEALTAKLLNTFKRNSRALSAYKVTVTVTPRKDGQQLDMGLLFKQLPMTAKLKDKYEPVPSPHLRGLVPSDVRIGNQKILDLGEFNANKGFSKTFTLFTAKDVKLKADSASSRPKGLIAQIKEKGPVDQETAWELTVSAVPNGVSSGLLENAFIQVEATRGTEPPHPIRIPVSGTARGSSF